MRHQLIWFFETPDGTLMNEFGRNQLVARMKLHELVKSPLKLVDTPLQSGRIAYEIESNRYGTIHKKMFIEIPDRAYDFDASYDPYHDSDMTPEKWIAQGGVIVTE